MSHRASSRKSGGAASEQLIQKTVQTFMNSIHAPFYTTGFVEVCPSLVLQIPDQEGGRPLAPPYTSESLMGLYENAEQSQVGTKEATVLRLDARRSKEFDNVTVQSDDSWPVERVCEEIQKSLAPGAPKVHAQLYKLLIYQKGDFFHCHQDAQQAANMFGSLLFFLPIEYEGGVFQLSRLQTTWSREDMIDIEDRKDPKGCSWVAFFTDVIHKVSEVRGGFRAVLNYTLSFEAHMCPSPSLSAFEPKDAQAVRSSFQSTPSDIVLPLFYSYTKASLSPAFLKGRDAHLFNAMSACGLEVVLQFVLRTNETVVTMSPCYDMFDEPDGDWEQEFRGAVALVGPELVEKSYVLDAELKQMEKEAREKQHGLSSGGYGGNRRDRWHDYWVAKEKKRRALVSEIHAAQKGKRAPTWIHLLRDDGGDLHSRGLWHVGSEYTTQWLGNMNPPVEFYYMEAAMVVKKES